MSNGWEKKQPSFRRTNKINYKIPPKRANASPRVGTRHSQRDGINPKKFKQPRGIEVFDPYYKTGFGPPRDNKKREIYAPKQKDGESFDPYLQYGYPEADSPTTKGLFYMFIAGLLLLVGSFVCGILGIIGLILAMIGFFKIYNDRDSYSEPHPTDTKKSLYFYLVGFIFIIIATIIILASAVSLIELILGAEDTSEAFDSFLLLLVLGSIFGTVGEIFRLVGRYKLLIGLFPPKKINLLKNAVIFAVVISIISLVLIPIFFDDLRGSFDPSDSEESSSDEFIPNYQYDEEVREFQQKTLPINIISSGFGFIIQLLFIYCFFIAYDHQKKNPQFRKNIQPPQVYPYLPPNVPESSYQRRYPPQK
jgi:hypothetical protein